MIICVNVSDDLSFGFIGLTTSHGVPRRCPLFVVGAGIFAFPGRMVAAETMRVAIVFPLGGISARTNTLGLEEHDLLESRDQPRIHLDELRGEMGVGCGEVGHGSPVGSGGSRQVGDGVDCFEVGGVGGGGVEARRCGSSGLALAVLLMGESKVGFELKPGLV